jgi:pyrophosphatase PpaX
LDAGGSLFYLVLKIIATDRPAELSSVSPFKAVLFDLDGTLIEFKFKVRESREAMIRFLQSEGFDVSGMTTETKTQSIFDLAESQLQSQAGLVGKGHTVGKIRGDLSSILDDFELRAFGEAKAHPGSLKVLRSISERGIKTAVVTNSGRKPVDALLGGFGFLPYLTLIITRDEVKKLKPQPDGLLTALEKLGVNAEDALYVGDSVIDIDAAKSAHVISVAVATGLYEAEKLADRGPNYLIRNIDELESIVFPQGAKSV